MKVGVEHRAVLIMGLAGGVRCNHFNLFDYQEWEKL